MLFFSVPLLISFCCMNMGRSELLDWLYSEDVRVMVRFSNESTVRFLPFTLF